MPEPKICPGPLIWFDVEATANETQAAVLECSTCGYIIASGWFHDEAHSQTDLLRTAL